MQHRRFRTAFMAASLLLTATLAPQSQAAIAITGAQVGSDYVFSYSGSLSLSGLSYFDTSAFAPGGTVESGSGYFVVGFQPASPTVSFDYYLASLTGPSAFGTGLYTDATSGTGSVFGMQQTGGFLVVPAGYVSGNNIAGTMVFAGASAGSLGLTVSETLPTNYSWSLANGDTVSMSLAPTAPPVAAPEPTRALLLMLGMGSLLLRRQRPGAPAQA